MHHNVKQSINRLVPQPVIKTVRNVAAMRRERVKNSRARNGDYNFPIYGSSTLQQELKEAIDKYVDSDKQKDAAYMSKLENDIVKCYIEQGKRIKISKNNEK